MTMLVCTGREVELDVVSPQQLLREQARVRVIVGKPIDVVTERVRAGRGQDPGLAHRRRRPCGGTGGARPIRSREPPASSRRGRRDPC